MTKPVTTVAALMLLDEGRFALDDPITKCAPELAQMRVLRDPEGPLDETDEATRPITFRDLLTHRSGLTYGDFHRGPIGRAYTRDARRARSTTRSRRTSGSRALATLPLIDQPGAGFHYGISTDLLGFLIARLEGAPLGDGAATPRLRAARDARHRLHRPAARSEIAARGCAASTPTGA